MKELELFSLSGLNAMFGRHKTFTPEPGSRCKNCDTELQGRYCFACGQDADTHHRNIFHLVWETIEGLFHLDGRLWRTLPPLFFRPGTLNRDYLEGRIARHVPPFRLFLVALLLFIFAAEHKIEHNMHAAQHGAHPEAGHAETGHAAASHSPPSHASEAPTEETRLALVKAGKAHSGPITEVSKDGTTVTRSIALFSMTEDDARYLAGVVRESDIQPASLKDSMVRALENPKHYFLLMFTWGHRLAVFLLPILGLVLAIVNFRKRQFYIYDHLIVAMNMLSFQFTGFALALAVPQPVGNWLAFLMILGTPLHLFFTMRGGYGSSIMSSIIKGLFVSLLTVVSFAIVLLMVMWVAVATI